MGGGGIKEKETRQQFLSNWDTLHPDKELMHVSGI
jgi:hypothetical protein